MRQSGGRERRRTYLIFILWFLVLHEQLQSLLADRRLHTATAAVPFLWFFVLIPLSFVLRLISLANHLRLTERPHNGHPCFGVTDMADTVRKIGIRLYVPQRDSGVNKMSAIHWRGWVALNNGAKHRIGSKGLQSASEAPSKASRNLLQRRAGMRLDHAFALLVQPPFHLTTGPPNLKVTRAWRQAATMEGKTTLVRGWT